MKQIATLSTLDALGALSEPNANTLYARISPRTKYKPQRIVGRYNPETDKHPDRNSPCKCGSGVKFKKCCLNKK